MPTATSATPVSKSGKLSRSEWDFAKLSPAELEICFAWEYGREWELLRQGLIAPPPASGAERERFEADPDAWLGCVYASMLLAHHARLDTPWQDLPKALRAELLDTAGTGKAGLEPLKPGDIPDAADLAAFRVNWEQSDKRLLADFARWLKDERTTPAREQRGRNRRDDLNMLGAMRLLHTLKLEDAIIETTRATGEPLYGKRPSWERARKTVLRVFREDFLIHAERWQEAQIPLRYAKLERD